MILESLVQNDMRVCLDCAKATLVRGGRITISDEFYQHREVQGAIKLGYIKLVGDPPAAYAAKPKESTTKLKNIWGNKIVIDCIKGTVEPGCLIEIPESVMSSKEVQNALAWGMLCDPSAPPSIVDMGSKAAAIEEVTLAGPSAPAKSGKASKSIKPLKSKKAKAISRVGDSEEAEEKDEDIPLYKESKVIDPSVEKSKKIFEAPKVEKKESEPDRFDFLSIFGEDEKK